MGKFIEIQRRILKMNICVYVEFYKISIVRMTNNISHHECVVKYHRMNHMFYNNARISQYGNCRKHQTVFVYWPYIYTCRHI